MRVDIARAKEAIASVKIVTDRSDCIKEVKQAAKGKTKKKNGKVNAFRPKRIDRKIGDDISKSIWE